MKTNSLTTKIVVFLFCFSFQMGVNAQERLVFSKEELISDFKYLCSSMKNDHPDLFAYLPESEYQKSKMQVFNSIQDSMSVEKFYLLIAPFVASLKNGHMNVSIPIISRIQFLNNGGLAFPLKVNIADDRLFVSVDLSKEQNVPVNAELLSINGIPSSEILKQMFGLMGAEINNEIKYSQISSYFSTLLWYIYHFENDYQLVILENDNKKDIHLQGITQKQYTEMMNNKKTFQNNQNPYNFRIDSLKNAAYLKIQSFADADKLSEFLKTSYQQLQSNHIDSLIIDVRDNGGGNSSSLDSLMNYLTDKPYKQYNKIFLKVSEDVKNVYKERHPDTYNEIKNLPNGQIYNFDNPFTEPKKQCMTYSGKIIVYVNDKTFSGASTFASLIDCLQIGTIIGHTGSPKIYCADFLKLKLPDTKIDYTVPIKEFYDCGTELVSKVVKKTF